MITVGRYEGKVVEVVMAKDQNNGDQIEIVLQATKGDHKGEAISFFGSFNGDAGPYTIDRMLLCGWKIGDKIDRMVNVPVMFVVKEETYKGNPRLVADIIKPHEGKATTPEERRNTSERDIADILSRAASAPKRRRERDDFDPDQFPPEAQRGTR